MTKEQHIETTTLPTIEELLSYPYEVKRERKEKQMKRLINHLYNAAAEGKRKIFVEETNLDCCNFSCLHIKNYTVTRGYIVPMMKMIIAKYKLTAIGQNGSISLPNKSEAGDNASEQ